MISTQPIVLRLVKMYLVSFAKMFALSNAPMP